MLGPRITDDRVFVAMTRSKTGVKCISERLNIVGVLIYSFIFDDKIYMVTITQLHSTVSVARLLVLAPTFVECALTVETMGIEHIAQDG